MDRILRETLVQKLQLSIVERVAIAPAQMDEEQVPNLYECVIKSRMTGDCHVRFYSSQGVKFPSADSTCRVAVQR